MQLSIHVAFIFYLSVIPMWLTTFSVTFPYCWLFLALISTQMKSCFSHWQHSICFSLSLLYLFLTCLFLLLSWGYVQLKFFSTCASYLTTVFIFYGTVIFLYLQLGSSHSMDTDKMASVFYTIISSKLNPLVCSLRNKEVKSGFKKVVGKAQYSLHRIN
jgi:olfactory receptor